MLQEEVEKFILGNDWKKGVSDPKGPNRGRTIYHRYQDKLSVWYLSEVLEANLKKIPPGWTEEKYDNDVYFVHEDTNVKKIRKSQIPKIPRGLTWVSNSCYLDSALLALFSTPTMFVVSKILMQKIDSLPICENGTSLEGVQKALKHIYYKIHTIQKKSHEEKSESKFMCSKLRKSLKKCGLEEEFGIGIQNDPYDFLAKIFSLFGSGENHTQTTTYALDPDTEDEEKDTEDEEKDTEEKIQTSSITNKNAGPIRVVTEQHLRNSSENVKISELLTLKDEIIMESWKPIGFKKTYKRKVSIDNLLYTPYLIVNIKRKGFNRRFNYKPISVDSNITIGRKNFQLSSVVMFVENSRHYVAIFKYMESWYYYNDMGLSELHKDLKKNKIINCGAYENVQKVTGKNPDTTGTMFFYTPVKTLTFEEIKDNKWFIFTKNGCDYCNASKKILEELNIPFRTVTVNENNKDTVYNTIDSYTNNYRYFPIIFNDGKFVGGYTEFKKMKL